MLFRGPRSEISITAERQHNARGRLTINPTLLWVMKAHAAPRSGQRRHTASGVKIPKNPRRLVDTRTCKSRRPLRSLQVKSLTSRRAGPDGAARTLK